MSAPHADHHIVAAALEWARLEMESPDTRDPEKVWEALLRLRAACEARLECARVKT